MDDDKESRLLKAKHFWILKPLFQLFKWRWSQNEMWLLSAVERNITVGNVKYMLTT